VTISYEETRKVLTKISQYDGRTVDEDTIKVWHRQIEPGSYVKAMQAVSLLAAEGTVITPLALNQRIDALWAEDAVYTPADENTDREGADKPENFEAMWRAWDDPVQFARERRIYQDQLDRDGYIGPAVS
jgi:hypothetical protein